MLSISERSLDQGPSDAWLELPFEQRSRSRLRARLNDGNEVGIRLARGQILRGGDRLKAADGRIIEVRAAAETVSQVQGADALLLARAAYHLGNRHVVLQLGPGWLRYLHDHVLDDLVRQLGLAVEVLQVPFEPEAGAYHADGSGGAHAHGHAHEHRHDE